MKTKHSTVVETLPSLSIQCALYLKDWHAGPGATTDIKADKIISVKWLIVFQSKYRCEWCGWHCSGCSSSRVPFSFRPPLSCPGANHQADRPGNGCEGGHQFQRGDRRQGRELYQRLRQGETRHSSRMVLKPETCPKCLDTEPEHRKTHNVNLEKGGGSPDLNISGFK